MAWISSPMTFNEFGAVDSWGGAPQWVDDPGQEPTPVAPSFQTQDGSWVQAEPPTRSTTPGSVVGADGYYSTRVANNSDPSLIPNDGKTYELHTEHWDDSINKRYITKDIYLNGELIQAGQKEYDKEYDAGGGLGGFIDKINTNLGPAVFPALAATILTAGAGSALGLIGGAAAGAATGGAASAGAAAGSAASAGIAGGTGALAAGAAGAGAAAGGLAASGMMSGGAAAGTGLTAAEIVSLAGAGTGAASAGAAAGGAASSGMMSGTGTAGAAAAGMSPASIAALEAAGAGEYGALSAETLAGYSAEDAAMAQAGITAGSGAAPYAAGGTLSAGGAGLSASQLLQLAKTGYGLYSAAKGLGGSTGTGGTGTGGYTPNTTATMPTYGGGLLSNYQNSAANTPSLIPQSGLAQQQPAQQNTEFLSYNSGVNQPKFDLNKYIGTPLNWGPGSYA